MAAEINNYFQVGAKFRGPNDVTMTINPAKAQWTLAQVKALFYLDGVIAFTANYGGTMYHGFWGTCIVGGANEAMHKSTRIVSVYGSTLGQSKRTFNDSGLNTLGWAQEPQPTSTRIGNVQGDILFKSAVFATSAAYWQYSINNSAWSTPLLIGSLGRFTDGTFHFNSPPGEFESAFSSIRLRGVNINEEGTFYGNIHEFILRFRFVTLSSGSYASLAYQNQGVNPTQYTTDRGTYTFGTGARLFTNDPQDPTDGVEAPIQYYSSATNWYQLEYVAARDRREIIAEGSTQQSGPFPNQWPPTDPNYENIISEGTSLPMWSGDTNADACNSLANNINQITPWKVTTNKKQVYFTDSSKQFTIPVAWYADSSGNTWFIADGIKGQTGFQCSI